MNETDILEENSEMGLSDALNSFFDFLVFFGKLEKDQVVQKFQNKAYYPNNHAYILFSLVESESIGRTFQRVETIEDKTFLQKEYTLIRLKIGVEIFEENTNRLFSLAQKLQQGFISEDGVGFLSLHKLSPLFMEDWKDISQNLSPNENNLFQKSLMSHFYLSYWNCEIKTIDSFTSVEAFVHNIDVLKTTE